MGDKSQTSPFWFFTGSPLAPESEPWVPSDWPWGPSTEELYYALIHGQGCAYLTDEPNYITNGEPQWVPVYITKVDMSRHIVDVIPASETPYAEYRKEYGYVVPDMREMGIILSSEPYFHDIYELNRGGGLEPILVTDYRRLLILDLFLA